AKEAFDKSLQAYRSDQAWDRIIKLTDDIIGISFNKNEFLLGIHAAKQTIEAIEQSAPQELKKCNYLLHDLGIMYDITNELQLAKATFEKELKVLPLSYPQDSSKTFAKAHQSLGIVLDRMGRREEALQSFYTSKKIFEQAVDCQKCGLNQGKLYTSIGIVLFALGEKEKAIQSVQDGLKLSVAELGENSPKLMRSYMNIGALYYELGAFQKSIDYYQKGLFMVEPYKDMLPPALKSNVVEAMNHLGINYLSLDQHDKALEYFNKSVEWSKSVSTERSEYYRISTTVRIGRVHVKEENFGEALKYFAKADSMIQHYKPKYEKADVVNNIDFILVDLWHQKGLIWQAKQVIDKAIISHKKSVHIFENLENRFTSQFSASCIELSNIYQDLGMLDSALFYNQRGLDLSATTPFDVQTETFKDFIIREHQDQFSVYTYLSNRAILLYELGNKKVTPSEKEAYLREALYMIDIMDAVHSNNLQKVNFLRGASSKKIIEESIKGYVAGLSYALHYYTNYASNDSILQKFFFYGKKMKAQELMLKHLKNEAIGFGQLDKALLQKESDLNGAINFYKKKLMEAVAQDDSAAISLYQNKYLFDKQLEYEQLQRELEVRHPAYFKTKYNFRPETIQGIQAMLREDEVLVEYFFTCCNLAAIAIAKNGQPQVSYLEYDREGTTQLVTSLNNLLHNSPMNRKSSREKFIDISHQFYNIFIQPIRTALAGKKRLIVVGDGVMNYIPFEILLPSDESQRFQDLDFLVKKYEVTYHYSATLLANARKEATRSAVDLYAFAPVYDDSENDNDNVNSNINNNGNDNDNSNVNNNTTTNTSSRTRLRSIGKDGKYIPLPNSEKEVQSIFKLFKNKNPQGNHKLSLREDASESNLKSELERPYRVVHIAGHSFANLEYPEFSGIACYNNQLTTKEDGTLFTGEIYNITSKSDLVTLSSCESGYGLVENTEGLIGLNRAFIYSGATNVMYSLWKVYDKVSAKLMVNFYSNVLTGKSYSESLRDAKLKLLEKEATASPHFWSPYLLIGR
ncbi:MAG: CHAT domain-containing tetratricopeptide repeat protein, partial [Bacteroidota bacterium]